MVERNLLSKNYQALLRTIELAHPDTTAPTLLAATKTQSAATVESIYELGIRHVGENYLDEALLKMEKLEHLDLVWHFIGRIQSNKTSLIANAFDWVHTVDRAKIARRLSSQRQGQQPLNVLIQVNIDEDQNKGGATPSEVLDLALLISTLPNLRLRGLMTILSTETIPREGYRSVAQLAQDVGVQLQMQPTAASAPSSPTPPLWDSLSMGMSGDIVDAIEAGATFVRIGTALFGPRAT